MDINSSSPAKTHRHLLYTTHLPPPPTAATTFNFNLNLHHHHEEAEYEEEEEEEEEKEPMFEKPLTPSDVGKLNRLVIPKQHAEKYFPLAGGDPAAEKGLLLSFEDESGKPWRFRYSYWNSSQSYVLTKGWSRYVKEKRLDAGDVVLFERHRIDAGRLFIGWRRRAATAAAAVKDTMAAAAAVCGGGGGGSNVDYSGGWTRVFYDTQSYPPPHPCYNAQSYPPVLISSLPYQPDRIHADPGGGGGRNGGERAASNGKRVRLFGVNLELETSPDQETSTTTTTTVSVSVSEPAEPPTPDGSSTSSSQLHLLHHHQDHHHHHQHNSTPYLSHHQYSHHPHPNLEMMDMMSRDMDTEMIKKGQHQYPYQNHQYQYQYLQRHRHWYRDEN